MSSSLEKYFKKFRDNVVGIEKKFDTPYGKKKMVYSDWTASGRLYATIENKIKNDFGPFVANTHTETSTTGTLMTHAYHEAKEIIKKHVNADKNDLIITTGSGMTRVVVKFQRILGLKYPEKIEKFVNIPNEEKPIVFVTHMEHHSNHTSWLETIADVVVIGENKDGLVCHDCFKELLEKYRDRKVKIAAITACSNITGIQPDVHGLAKIIHQHDGLCFVDYACSAPYVNINMHPEDPLEKLDAIVFSPHKFLGGPGSTGVLIFNSKLYTNKIPDTPGGGTVAWTNAWGGRKYFEDVEIREDGGTPAFLQTIRSALAVKLKEKMGVENILKREEEMLHIIFDKLNNIKGLHVLANNIQHRLGVVSFYFDNFHFNLCVKLLNDKFGIQTRGGCSCAGTYGHYLLGVTKEMSQSITNKIDNGNLSDKPGWVRMSINPVMTNEEIEFVCNAIKQVSENCSEWKKDYVYDEKSNEFYHRDWGEKDKTLIDDWFEF